MGQYKAPSPCQLGEGYSPDSTAKSCTVQENPVRYGFFKDTWKLSVACSCFFCSIFYFASIFSVDTFVVFSLLLIQLFDAQFIEYRGMKSLQTFPCKFLCIPRQVDVARSVKYKLMFLIPSKQKHGCKLQPPSVVLNENTYVNISTSQCGSQ